MKKVEATELPRCHILFLIHSLSSGGAERVVVNLANFWVEKGWKVTVATFANQEEDFYEIDPMVRRIALDLARDSTSVVAGIWNNMLRVAAVRRMLDREKPDVALGFMSTASCQLALAGPVNGCLRIGTERVYPPMIPLGRVWEKIRKWAYGRLDAVVALDMKGANWIRTHTYAKRVPIIFNPVPLPLRSGQPVLPPELVVSPSRKLVLSVGRLTAQKGFDRAILAFAQLASEFPEWDLAIVGDGPLRPTLTALSREVGLVGRLHLPGRAGNIADWYRAADLFVLTSHFEGFPNVLAEALAHGLPAVSVDCDTGPRDIITDGQNGFLVAEGNQEALVNALRHIMRNDNLRKDMGINAEKVQERLSVEKIAGQWEKLFEILQNRCDK